MKQNTDNNNEKFTGAEIFVKCLEAEGIELVFGYPGGAVLHIYDELHKQNEVSHILVRHEQGAVHAAEGFAKSSDKPGVVLVTSGPGATNSITGIADAYMDSVPIVIFTGQVRTALIGNDAFQEVDTVGITRPCVKHNFMITDVKDMASTIKKLFMLQLQADLAQLWLIFRRILPRINVSSVIQIRLKCARITQLLR